MAPQFLSWKNVYNFYKFHTCDNEDFLKKIIDIPLTNYQDDSVPILSQGTNMSLIEGEKQLEILTKLYNDNGLVTIRLGCVESSFFMHHLLDFKIPSHLLIDDQNDIDNFIKKNAGLYYSDAKDKKKVLDWWCNETRELLLNDTTVLTSVYCFLNFDICLWALLNIKRHFYNYGYMTKILLRNSEGKKILYVGNGVDSIKAGYERGLQNAWKFPVSNFSMYYLKTPQTTLGCKYPHDTMIQTCEAIINEVIEKYSDFDTAIFGCGVYAAPLINNLRKKFPSKNLIYLGSDCFKMFGVYSKLMPYTYFEDAIKENWIEVVETLPEGCENHPEKRYWKN
jgi:hypothetical protein